MTTVDGTSTWRRVPLRWSVDLERGGRWTSLSTADREWLWTNPDPATAAARATIGRGPAVDAPPVVDAPPFVDAGGGEECWPTVRGVPDHGAVWSRAWAGRPADAEVGVTGLGSLRRRIGAGDVVDVDYEITGAPGTGFLHAVHLLLDVGPDARLVLPGRPVMTVLDSDHPRRTWPDGLDRLGPDDGTAVCALVPDTSEVTVLDGDRALRLRWHSPDQPGQESLLLWRNLGGWPDPHPYRSIGIEPMLGRAVDRLDAAPDDLAVVGRSGLVRWTLQIEALEISRGGETRP